MATTPNPPVTPQPPQPPQGQTQTQADTTPAPSPAPGADTGGVTEQVATLKSDLHKAAEDAKTEFWQISATARMDVHKIITDLEALHGVSLAALKKVLGV